MSLTRRRTRGFSLSELMIALALSTMVAAGALILVRTQLQAYELNDSMMKAQQNARAGLEFVETQLRRACGGISQGSVAINLPGAPPSQKACVQYYNGASLSGASFTSSTGTGADAIEILYATGNSNSSYAAINALTSFPPTATTAPVVTVSDMTGFSVGDYVIVTNWQQADLLRIATINGGAAPATGIGPITFGSLTASAINAYGYTPAVGDGFVKVASIALYFVPGSGVTPGQLYLDPDGMLGTDHSDAQPLIDGASDFQLAFGLDWQTIAPANGTAKDGIITENLAAGRGANDDEWIGNVTGETLPLITSAATLWNVSGAPPLLLQIRSTILVRTINTYGVAIPNVGPYENGATITSADSAGRYPRYRPMRSLVAPRAWNLGE